MATSHKDSGNSSVNRRKLLAAVGVTLGGSIAGCLGDDSTADEDLGERVPEIQFDYWSGFGHQTAFMEAAIPLLNETFEELGLQVDYTGNDIGEVIGDIIQDARTHHMMYGGWTVTPDRLDPNGALGWYDIRNAGATGSINHADYANCDYSELVAQQATAETEDERRDVVHEAQEVLSEDYVTIPITKIFNTGVARTDQIDLESVGVLGIDDRNIDLTKDSTPTGDHPLRITVTGGTLEGINHFRRNNITVAVNNYLSPLLYYNADAELTGNLAEDWSIEDDGRRFVFELRDVRSAEGEQVTAEDVKFTYEFQNANHGEIRGIEPVDYSSIDVIDETTVAFNFDEPTLSFLSYDAPRYGIIMEETWAEADGQVMEFSPEPHNGTGIWVIDSFNRNQDLILKPNENHPLAPDPAEHNGYAWLQFTDTSSKVEAIRAGEIDLATELPPPLANQLVEDNPDSMVSSPALEGTAHKIEPKYSFGPGKFKEFRRALGAAINRQDINVVAWRGEPDDIITEARLLTEDHPYGAPEGTLAKFTDDPSGDVEEAKRILEEEGWGWDSDGRLHYPQEADLSPLWPEGETPESDDFPCLDDL